MSFIVGITGGIGAGKTTALEILAEQGLQVLDSDRIVHDLYQPGTVVNRQLRERWGDGVQGTDGNIDRQTVAEIVFAAPEERAWLERQVHPRVMAVIVQQAAASQAPLYCGIPLLFEVGWQDCVQASVCVWCSPAVQRQRLTARGWSDLEIDRRLDAQLSMDTKLERADFGLINNSTRELLQAQLNRLTKTIHIQTDTENKTGETTNE